MMDSGPVRNMYSTLSNKCEKFFVLLAFIMRSKNVLIPSQSTFWCFFLRKLHFIDDEFEIQYERRIGKNNKTRLKVTSRYIKR